MQQIGFGTAAIGRPQYINIRVDNSSTHYFDKQVFEKKGLAILDYALKHGIKYFDTAPGYGMAEEIMSKWLARNSDQEVQIGTKWGYKYVANFDLHAEQHEIKEHSLSMLNDQWDNSAKLLPKLSLYQIHSATLATGVLDNKEILLRMQELKNQNDFLLGVTVSGANQVEILKRALDIELDGQYLFDSIQATYNMLDQSLSALRPQLKNRQVIIKEALANGRIFRNESYPHYNHLYDELERIANKNNVNVDAVALRFAMQNFKDGIVLSGAATINQLRSNLKANSFSLNKIDLDSLSKLVVSPKFYWLERSELKWN